MSRRQYQDHDRLSLILLMVSMAVVAFAFFVSAGGFEKAPERARNTSLPAAYLGAAPTTPASKPSGPPPVSVERPADRPLRVMFVGDSLTAGVHATVEENAFRSLMIQQWAKGGRVEPVTAAISGANTGRVTVVADVPPNLDIAVIELGTNDVTRTPMEEFDRLYGKLLDRVRATSRGAAVICAGVWRPQHQATPFDDIIQRHCERVGGRYLDMHDLFEDEDNRGPAGLQVYGGEGGHNISDDFHPNDTGYRAIADRLLPLVEIVPA